MRMLNVKRVKLMYPLNVMRCSQMLSQAADCVAVGRVAMLALRTIYEMWNASHTKREWTAEFISYLKLVEGDLVRGQKAFDNQVLH